MAQTERFLSKSETLQLRTGLHPVVMNGQLALAMLIFAAACGAIWGAEKVSTPYRWLLWSLAAVLLVTATVIVIKALLLRASRTVLVTNERVIELCGIWSQRVRDIRIDAIQEVSIDQSVFGRLFNFGTVTLQAGNDTPLVLENIRFPLELHQALMDHKPPREQLAAV